MSAFVSNGLRAPAGAQDVEFMILSRGRTGSTVIVDDIDLHPDICCYQEVFNLIENLLPVHSYAEWARISDGKLTIDEYVGYLRGGKPASSRALGYKVLTSHIEEHPDRMDYLLSGRIKVIFSIRNSVGVALSSAIAAARGIHNVKAADGALRSQLETAAPVVLDPQWIVDEVKYDQYWRTIWTERLQALDHIVLDYDHYIRNRAAELNRCFAFLGQEPTAVGESRFIKVTSNAYADEIANKGEVIDALDEAGLDLSPLIQ